MCPGKLVPSLDAHVDSSPKWSSRSSTWNWPCLVYLLKIILPVDRGSTCYLPYLVLVSILEEDLTADPNWPSNIGPLTGVLSHNSTIKPN